MLRNDGGSTCFQRCLLSRLWEERLTWNSNVFGFAMCTALDDDKGLLSFSDTSSREHCRESEKIQAQVNGHEMHLSECI